MIHKSFLLFFVLSFSAGCVQRHELGSKKNPIKMSLVPGQDAAVLSENGKVLADFLEKETGFSFQIAVPNNFITVVESFGTKRTDVAMINSFGYLLAQKKYGAHVRLVGTNKGRAEYYGQIITANPKIKNVEDLKGKTFAYVDPASTSGYILPSSLLKKLKIQPKETIFAGKHDSVVSMVYQNRVDAGATFHVPSDGEDHPDARKLVLTQYPDVYKKVRILTLTQAIPSDPVVFAKELPLEIEEKIVQGILKFASTTHGKETFKRLYNVDGFNLTTDKNYDPLRQILEDIGKPAEDFVQ